MTTFWLLAAALAALATACLLPPLLRRPHGDVPGDTASVSIYHHQLRELDADLRAGILDPARHAEARDELGRRLLDDVDDSDAGAAARHDTLAATTPASMPATRPSPLLAAILLATIPSAAIGLYLHLGNPMSLWDGADTTDGHDLTEARVEAMVTRLAERLQAQPADPEGWTMLARSYTALGRPDDAAAAWGKAVDLAPDDAALRADYADALATANGGRLDGPAAEQIARGLALDPDDPKSLALSASAAMERGDLPGAIGQWEHLLRVLPRDSQVAGRVSANIDRARTALAKMQSAKARK